MDALIEYLKVVLWLILGAMMLLVALVVNDMRSGR